MKEQEIQKTFEAWFKYNKRTKSFIVKQVKRGKNELKNKN